jgi:hypothetical protein
VSNNEVAGGLLGIRGMKLFGMEQSPNRTKEVTLNGNLCKAKDMSTLRSNPKGRLPLAMYAIAASDGLAWRRLCLPGWNEDLLT